MYQLFKQYRKQEQRSAVDFSPARDVVELPETFFNVLEHYDPGMATLIVNQNGAYSFGAGKPKETLHPAEVLRLYRHPELPHVLCVRSTTSCCWPRAWLSGRPG